MASNSSATLVKAAGSVYVERNGTRYSLAEGDELFSTDTIITDSSATAELAFADGTQATLSPGTTLEIQEFVFETGKEPSFILGLTEGAMRSVSGEIVRQNPEAFSIRTPQSTIGIRGTELFNSVIDGKETHVVLHIGKGHIVLVTTPDGRQVAMDGPMHGIELASGNNAPIVVQKYTFDQMEDLIRDIAPSLANDLAMTPQAVQNMDAQQLEQSAEQVAAHAAAVASSSSVTVTILVEENAQADPAVAEALANIQTTLQDMGVTLNVLATTTDNVLTENAVQANLAEMAPSFTAESGLSAGDTSSTTLAPKPNAPGANLPQPPVGPTDPPVNPPVNPPVGPTDPPVNPPVNPPTTPDQPVTRTYENITGEEGTTHLTGLGAGVEQKFVVTGSVNASLVGNALFVGSDSSTPSASTAGDTFELGTVDIPLGEALNAGVFADAQVATATSGVNAAFGADTMTIANLKNGIVAGDVHTATEQSGATNHNSTITFGNDAITITSTMQNGAVVGDAYIVEDVSGATFNFGKDGITIATAQSGVIAGDAHTVKTIQSGNLTFGKDTININTISGNAILAGDAHTLENISGGSLALGDDALDITLLNGAAVTGDVHTVSTVSGGTMNFGDDNIKVSQMQSGTLSGDAHTISNANGGSLNFGDDTIHIDTLTNGIVVGDVHTFTPAAQGRNLHMEFGNDNVTLQTMGRGIVSGDAHTIEGASTPLVFGNDTIQVTDMQGGTITGDVYALNGLNIINSTTTMGDDSITVENIANGAEVSGDVYTIAGSAGSLILGDDTIHVTNLNGGTIWGDFKSVTGNLDSIVFGSDTIYVTNYNGGKIYGDGETSQPSYANAVSGGDDTIHIKNLNAATGLIDAGIGDDTVIVENINTSSTVSIVGGAGFNTFQYNSATGHTMTLQANGEIAINGHNINLTYFQGLAGGSGDDTLIVKVGSSTPTLVNSGFTPELTGGAGADTFKLDYSANPNGSVVIKDFDATNLGEKIMVKTASGSYTFSFNEADSTADKIVIDYSDGVSTSHIILEGLNGSSEAIYNQIISNGQLSTFS